MVVQAVPLFTHSVVCMNGAPSPPPEVSAQLVQLFAVNLVASRD